MRENRYEIKFLVTEDSFHEFRMFIKNLKANKKYPNRSVNSIYFDNKDYDSVRDNLSGIYSRKKVRIRWYQKERKSLQTSLEVKIKQGRAGTKDRILIDGLANTNMLEMSLNNIKKETFKNLKVTNPSLINDFFIPTLFVNYIRSYYETKDNVRVTVDKKINFRRLSPFHKVSHFKSVSYNNYVVELKFPLNLKSYVSSILSKYPFTPVRHSKYLTGIAKLGHSIYI